MADEITKVKKISDAMQEIDALAKTLVRQSEDKLLVCAALLAVTRQHYVEALGNEHTYRNKVNIPHGRKETKWCTIHRQHEVIKAHYNPKGNGYFYWVSRHKKSL